MFVFTFKFKSGHRKFLVRCRVGGEIFPPRAEWAAKIFSVKSYLTPLPPPPVINNDRSLREHWKFNQSKGQLKINLGSQVRSGNFRREPGARAPTYRGSPWWQSIPNYFLFYTCFPDDVTKKQKVSAIQRVLRSQPVDVPTLCQFAISRGGLLTDKLRLKVWPKLLKVDLNDIPPKPGIIMYIVQVWEIRTKVR